LQAIVARGGGTWTQRSPGIITEYALPTHACGELLELFREQTSALEASPEFIAQVPGGRVFGSGAVLSADGASIARDVSVDFGKPFSKHWLLGYQRIRAPVFIGGTTAVAATALGHGYAHWLLEELPRLLSPGVAECETIIAHATSAISREALKRLQLTTRVREPRRYSHFGCEHLIVPSLAGQPGFPTPRVGETLGSFTEDLSVSTSGIVGERLYVSRQHARRRRVTNEAELWALLQSRGFVKLHTEELTWAEQIAAFRQAKVVVAPHGAGLANIVFCRPGTVIVEVFNRSYVNGCYWRLAAVQQLDYRPVVAQGTEPLGSSLSANSLDIRVDPAQVTKVLSLL
jgi:capsular polysaccharide biosynthesis protein